MSKIMVGYSEVNINPQLGCDIFGYYIQRKAKGFLSDLLIKALAICTDNKKVLVFSADLCLIKTELCNHYRNLISGATGIDFDSIFITTTHTHTGPYLTESPMAEADAKQIEAYASFVGERLIDAALMALADIKSAKMGYITGYAPERVAYIRRYKMKDGSTMTCPPLDGDIDHPIGTLDQRVHVLRIDREYAESIVLVNYGVHADTVGGEYISADFPVWMAETLTKALDGVKCMFLPGAQGDVGSTNVKPTGGDMNDTEISFDNEMKSPGMARFVGRALAGTVLQVYDKVCYFDASDIEVLSKDIFVSANIPDKKDLPLAHKYKELHDAGRDDEIPYKAMELTTVVAEAVRMCALENAPAEFKLTVSGIKLGNIALVTIPGEPFTEIGVAIKDSPNWDMIMPCVLTNGSEGYFPVRSAFDEGGYEARTSTYKGDVADKIINGCKAILDELKNSDK